MRDLRFANAWRTGGFLLLGLALAALLAPGPATALPMAGGDKLAHVVGFFGMTLWFTGVYRRDRHGYVALGMLMFGVVSELLQGLLTRSRSADPVDFAADALGIGLALVAARSGGDGWTGRVERLLVGP